MSKITEYGINGDLLTSNLLQFFFFQDENTFSKIKSSFGDEVSVWGKTWAEIVEILCSLTNQMKRLHEEETKKNLNEICSVKEEFDLMKKENSKLKYGEKRVLEYNYEEEIRNYQEKVFF